MHPNLRTRKKFICWIGMLTETFLIAHATLASADRTQTPPQPPGMAPRPANKNPSDLGAPGFEQSRNPHSPYFEDEDEEGDDDDFFSRFPNQPGGAHPPGTALNHQGNITPGAPGMGGPAGARSGGGLNKSEGPDPVRTNQGISIGGQSPNGLISNSSAPVLKIDDESAEGSKELVTDFNFPDADILDLAKTLGKLTGKNFILDKEVKGKVSIITNSPITVSQAWKLFLTALDVNGFALVPSGAYLRIAKQRDARDKQLKTYTGDSSPDTDALITRVFSLKYISADEVQRTFRNLMPATSRIIPYEQTNTIIVTDTGSNITRLAKLLEILDVEGFDAGIEVISVKFASAAELAKLIDTLIPGTGASTPGAGGPPGAARMGGGRFNARRTKEGGIINTIIADERTNTLIVHANVKGTDQVRELVAKLDLKVPTSFGGGKVRVVYLQFADAEQVASTLNNFSTQTKGGGGSPGGGTGTGTNPIAASLFEGSIKISPDKATNSLVITASPTDFVTVQRVINQLDIPREQVYVEVVLMDVSMQRGFDFSANAAAPGMFLGSTPGGASDLGFLQNGPLGIFGNTGALATIPLSKDLLNLTSSSGQQISGIPSAFAIIKAAQNNQNVSVLATPQIIALDNTEATFESAEKIPVPTNNAMQGATLSQTYNKESISTSIKIKPQINKIINFVKMDVTVKLGDIDNTNVPKNVIGNAVGIIERTSTTTVLVGDSDTVVLGGLMRDKASEQTVKVPLLGDIPILGWLFKAKSNKVEKRNLLIFMTPHIIRQYEKVRTILDKKLKERDEFLELNTGGTDPLRYQRDSIIRSLPDLKELTEKHPPTTVNIDDDRSQPETPNPSPTPSAAAREIAPPSIATEKQQKGPLVVAPAPIPSIRPDDSITTIIPKDIGGASRSDEISPAPATAPSVNAATTTPTPAEPMKSVPAPAPMVPVPSPVPMAPLPSPMPVAPEAKGSK